MKKGDFVKFKEIKEAGDNTIPMVVLEDRDNRVLDRSLIWKDGFNPTNVYLKDELVQA